MSFLKITEAEMDNTVSASDSPTFYIEKNGDFRRVSLETIRNLIMESDMPLNYRTVKNDSGNNCTINDNEAIVGEKLYRARIVYPYKSGGYGATSTRLSTEYTDGDGGHGEVIYLQEQGFPNPPTFYGGTIDVMGNKSTITYLYLKSGEVNSEPTVRTFTILGEPILYASSISFTASNATSIEISYYVACSGVPADSKVFYNMIQTLTARVEALEQQ